MLQNLSFKKEKLLGLLSDIHYDDSRRGDHEKDPQNNHGPRNQPLGRRPLLLLLKLKVKSRGEDEADHIRGRGPREREDEAHIRDEDGYEEGEAREGNRLDDPPELGEGLPDDQLVEGADARVGNDGEAEGDLDGNGWGKWKVINKIKRTKK